MICGNYIDSVRFFYKPKQKIIKKKQEKNLNPLWLTMNNFFLTILKGDLLFTVFHLQIWIREKKNVKNTNRKTIICCMRSLRNYNIPRTIHIRLRNMTYWIYDLIGVLMYENVSKRTIIQRKPNKNINLNKLWLIPKDIFSSLDLVFFFLLI